MKSFFLKYTAAVLVTVALLAAAAWNSKSENTYVIEDENGITHEYDFAPPKSYQKVFARDTMSSAGSTTVDIPWIMASPYQYQYYIRLRKISGTPNTKIVLDEANSTGSTLWSPIDSVSCSGADSVKVHFRLRGTTVYGVRQRLRFVKTGTNTLQRDIILNIKPPNQ